MGSEHFDETQRYFTGVGDPELAKKRATDFMKNGGAMAAQAVHNAITLNESAFGLEGPEREMPALRLRKLFQQPQS